MTKVIITVGIPGSGKSYFAKRYQAEHENTRIIERDIIRESLRPGYYKGKPDKNFEKEVTANAQALLKSHLENPNVETVIISDTNLNLDRRISLEKEIRRIDCKSEIEIKILEDSADLDLCSFRNRNREKRVPEEVLCRFYRKFRHLYPPQSTNEGKELIFVGDIHSQYTSLQKLVKKFGFDKYHYVFLGDINDSRCYDDGVYISFFKCYELIRMMVDFGCATLVHSNHQKNLINAIRGKRKKASWGLKSTLDELVSCNLLEIEYKPGTDEILKTKSSEKALDIANWLDTRPFYFERLVRNPIMVRDLQGNLVEAVSYKGPNKVIGIHAQYLPEHCNSPYDVSGRGVEAAIYGTRKRESTSSPKDRVFWWKNYNEDNTYVISGHYHNFYVGPFCAVIDSGCGQGGPLCAFNYDTREVHLFGIP